MNIVIPMAGLGSRFSEAGFDEPKPLIKINGKPMIVKALETLSLQGNYTFITQQKDNLKKILEPIYPSANFIEINYITEGPAATCLLAKKYINNKSPLLIANCDQIMWWNSLLFNIFVENFPYDGFVVTYTTNTPKNSYAKIDKNGFVKVIKEKEVISDISTNGIHFWSKGSDFIESAEMMIKSNERYNNEFYIAPTYNSMIKVGKKITTYHIPNFQHHAVGTPSDLQKYKEKEKNENT